MWFLGVLERLLRPLMRTLSLQNDTSQGDGGPPLSSHSPSSVVDASNVASNTMIPPSPTCNRNKEKKKKKKTKIMELLSTEFSSNYFTRPRNIFTSAARRKYPFSLRERKKKISTTRIVFKTWAITRNADKVDFCFVRAFAPTYSPPPLQFARRTRRVPTTQTYPRCSPEIKDWRRREYPHARNVYLKRKRSERYNFV